MPLSDAEIRAGARKGTKGRKSDGGGLYIQDWRYWRMAYTFDGKQKTLAFGVYPDVSLQMARERRAEAKKLLALGVDPGEEKKRRKEEARQEAAGARTFESVAREWLEQSNRTGEVKAITEKRKRYILEHYLIPALGSLAFSSLNRSMLRTLPILKEHEKAGHLETVKRMVRMIQAVCRFAVQNEIRDDDPSAFLGGCFMRPKVTHRAAILEESRYQELIKALYRYTTESASLYYALQLMPMLFTRNSELCHAEWEEIDLGAGVWTIPASRAKMNRPFVIPLPVQARQIFRELYSVGRKRRYVFESSRSKTGHIRIESLSLALRTLGFPGDEMTVHGFRSSAVSFLISKFHYPKDVTEAALSHVPGVPLGDTYIRTDYREERKEMLQNWADYLDTLRGRPVL